jgi:hypothetical protein
VKKPKNARANQLGAGIKNQAIPPAERNYVNHYINNYLYYIEIKIANVISIYLALERLSAERALNMSFVLLLPYTSMSKQFLTGGILSAKLFFYYKKFNKA